MALHEAFLQPLLQEKHLEKSEDIVNCFIGHVLKRCILIFNYQMVMKASFILFNSVSLMALWGHSLLSSVPNFRNRTKIQTINRIKSTCRSPCYKSSLFFLEFVSNWTWTFASQRGKPVQLVSGPQLMWICQNDLLDFRKCQTAAPLIVTHPKSTFQMGT